jgi:non-heme chloroperoxidase
VNPPAAPALHVVELAAGAEPPLVLLHGWGETHAAWRASVAALARARRAVAFDLRGHGDSGWPADGDYSLDATVADLSSVVERVGAPHVVLVGHSTGGMTALAFAARAASRVAGLALLDVDPLRFKDGLERLLPFAGPETAATLEELAVRLREAGDRRDPAVIAASLASRMRRGGDGLWRWRQDPRLRPRDGRRPHAPLAGAAVEEMLRAVARAGIASLVVRGAESRACTADAARRAVTLLGSGSRLEEIAGVGHDLPGEAAGAVARALDRFLARLGRAEPASR